MVFRASTASHLVFTHDGRRGFFFKGTAVGRCLKDDGFYIDGCFQKNNDIPKSSILIGFSIINHPFWGTLLFGNTQIKTRFFRERLNIYRYVPDFGPEVFKDSFLVECS